MLRSIPLSPSMSPLALDVCFGKNGRWNPGNLRLTTPWNASQQRERETEREKESSRRMSFKPLFSPPPPPPLKSNTDKFSSHPTPLEGEREDEAGKEGRKESQREKLAR